MQSIDHKYGHLITRLIHDRRQSTKPPKNVRRNRVASATPPHRNKRIVVRRRKRLFWPISNDDAGSYQLHSANGHKLTTIGWVNPTTFLVRARSNQKVLQKDGHMYRGAVRNHVPHGFGVIFYDNGDYFSGHWQNGRKHGYGCYRYFESGVVYDGEWLEDKFIFGEISKSNDYYYFGNVVNGRKHGRGLEIIYKNSRKHYVYFGRFVNNRKKGQGEFQTDNIHYIGQVLNGLPYGHGQLRVGKKLQTGLWWNGRLLSTNEN